MKKEVVVLMVAVVAGLTFAAANDSSEADGGMVKVAGKGFAALIDCREKPPTVMECPNVFGTILESMQVELRPQKGAAFSFETASDQLAKSKANAAVFIIEDPTLPLTLSAPEAKWSLINFTAVTADHADEKIISRRLSLLIIRQLFRALGSDVTKTPDNCFYSVYSLADLDKITSDDLALNPYMALVDNLERLGMEKIERYSYRDACEEGLAPTPTNAVQKAIWDEVHALPKDPITIKPEVKKVTR